MKAELERLIGQGKTGLALQKLVAAAKHLPDVDLRQDILMLSARYQKMARDKDMNLITPENLNIEENKINKAILNLAGKLDKGAFGRKKAGGQLWKILGGVAILIGIAAGIAEFTGYSLRDLFGGAAPEVVQPADSTTTTIQTEGDQSPAVQSEGDVNINFGDTQPKQKEEEKPKEAAPTPKKPAGGLQIETKGQQSPAVQGGNVEINYSNTDTTKQQ